MLCTLIIYLDHYNPSPSSTYTPYIHRSSNVKLVPELDHREPCTPRVWIYVLEPAGIHPWIENAKSRPVEPFFFFLLILLDHSVVFSDLPLGGDGFCHGGSSLIVT